MGTARPPAPVKLLAGLLAASDALLDEAAAALRERFGPLDALSAPRDWRFSTYYEREMGHTVRRCFLSFERLIAPAKLASIKQATNRMEATWRDARGRQVNIDPGYVTPLKLVLASTKDAAHRVYLRGGICAEATLHFRNGSFTAHADTYPDYADAAAIAFFNGVRVRLLAQLRLRR
jgi:hypothetical protein